MGDGALHLVYDVTVDIPGTGQVLAGWYDHHELNEHTVVSVFEYAASYLRTEGSYNLSPTELEFRTGSQPSRVTDFDWGDHSTRHTWPHHFIQDLTPDGWGRAVLTALGGRSPTPLGDRGEGYLLVGTPDAARQGAVRLWTDGEPVYDHPLPEADEVAWPQLARATGEGAAFTRGAFVMQLAQGVGQGGAYPKLSITEHGRPRLAKLPQLGWAMSAAHEWVAMQLARDCGIRVSDSDLRIHDGHAVLFVNRFDRLADGTRLGYVSARTLRGGTVRDFPHLADVTRMHSQFPEADCRELFTRAVFNTVVGITDFHGKNHGFLYAGSRWALSPAFDLMPDPPRARPRVDRERELGALRASASRFLLSGSEAESAIAQVMETVRTGWAAYAVEAQLDTGQQAAWKRRLE